MPWNINISSCVIGRVTGCKVKFVPRSGQKEAVRRAERSRNIGSDGHGEITDSAVQ
jgi:hypothetical protein